LVDGQPINIGKIPAGKQRINQYQQRVVSKVCGHSL